MDCLFCKIGEGTLPSSKVKETENFLAFLDIHPVHLGHTLVIPKAHYENIFELPSALLGQLVQEVQIVAKAVKEATGADGINIMMNNLRASGQIIDHAHIHIIPRFQDDGLAHWPNKTATKEELDSMSSKIGGLL